MGGVKRIFQRGEELPVFLAPGNRYDLRVIELKDGRRVVFSEEELLKGRGCGWRDEETAEWVIAYVEDDTDTPQPWLLR